MGLFDYIFGARKQGPSRDDLLKGFKTFTEYNPMFSTYRGAIYEQELTRSCIERFSSACGKLKPEVVGNPSRDIVKMIKTRPNKYTTWPAFLSRAATMFECDATIAIVPVFKNAVSNGICGIQVIKFETAEIVEYVGEPWVRFKFATGDEAAIELKYVAFVSKFQYTSDFFGEPNCIERTMQLLHSQALAEDNAIKNGAKIRFIAAVAGQMREEDMREKRKRFAEDNLGADNDSGLMIYDTTFRDLKQVEPQSWVMEPEEVDRIEKNVYNYFGICEEILQNRYTEDIWGAWYEGKIEPFAVKLGEAITNMLFTEREQTQSGTRFTLSASRLEYASNASKRNMVRDCVDRGIMYINEGREVLQLPPLPADEGNIRVIRGEYINVSAIEANTLLKLGGASNGINSGRAPMNENEDERDLGGDDQIYQDSNAHNSKDE